MQNAQLPAPYTRLWPRPRRVELDGSRVPVAALRSAPRRVRDASFSPQAYRLVVEGGGTSIVSATEHGERYADATLAQLRELSDGMAADGSIAGATIDDAPDFQRRGVLIDVSRTKIPTMETLRALVDTLARLKVNELTLYTEHTFAYRGHESVWRNASPITPDEARALDDHCMQRGIALVPNQQSLGHMHRWLTHPRYRMLAEVPEGVQHAFSRRIEPFSLCPSDPDVLALLADLYDQLLPCFRTRELDVGLDETFDIGRGRSRAACAERGTTSVYLEHVRAVHRLAAERGRRIHMWGDIVLQSPERAAELPDDVTLRLWGYDADHDFDRDVRAAHASGRAFYVCPGTSSWQSIAGRTANMRANVASAARAGVRGGAHGYLVTDWGDRGHLQPLSVSYAGWLLGAGAGWNAATADDATFDLPLALDTWIFRDEARVLGRVACALGDAYRLAAPGATNGSALFFVLAFAGEPLPHPRLPGLRAADLHTALDYVRAERRALADARPTSRAGEIAREELVWAADLLAFACRLGIARCNAAPGAPITALAARVELASELAPLVAEHARLWALRNRPGGRVESASWLTDVFDALA